MIKGIPKITYDKRDPKDNLCTKTTHKKGNIYNNRYI